MRRVAHRLARRFAAPRVPPMPATTIAAIRATPVTVPQETPLLHSNGAHWGRFVRTVVEVETADGYVTITPRLRG
jgi:hypothetical protein